jgi:circadian clock protein KaiC
MEIDGQLKRALAVVKVRSSQHSKELREYGISADGGISIGQVLTGYRGLLTGTPTSGESERASDAKPKPRRR